MLTNRFYNPTDPLWEALEKPEARGENNKTLLLLKAYDAIEKARQALIGSTRAKIGDIACCIQLLLIAADAALKEIITIIAEATNTNIDEVLRKHTSYYIDDTTEDNNMLVDELVQVNEEKKLVKIVMDCTQHCNICDQLEPILTSRQHDIAVCIKIGEALITATAKIKRTPTLCVHGRDAPYMLDYEKYPKHGEIQYTITASRIRITDPDRKDIETVCIIRKEEKTTITLNEDLAEISNLVPPLE